MFFANAAATFVTSFLCTSMALLTNEDKILTKNSPDLKPVDYSAWGLYNRRYIVTKFQTLTS